MDKTLHITATLDQPSLLENMVEKLACRRYDIGYGKAKLPQGRKALETSTTETYVSGTVALECEDATINMPFITCFLFTCLKENNNSYKLAFSTSLS